jgi:hypothetical protein
VARACPPGLVAFVGGQAPAVRGDDPGPRARLDRARAGGIPTSRMQASPVLRPLLPHVASRKESS